MKKLKRNRSMDRFSELPESLIFNIFEFLPMTDVVRTTILSRRWKNLWTTTPNLNFDKFRSNYDADKFRNFVNRALLRWRGTRVHKFKISCRDRENLLVADVDLWLRFAIDNGVEELHISYWSPTCVPQCVYSCSSLKKLRFDYCNLKINGNVEWNQLKSLSIIVGERVTQNEIDQILGGSPLLEVFDFSRRSDDELILSFRSSSLKELSIRKSIFGYTAEKPTELRIWAPNLETLTISRMAYSKYLLENVSSLTHATLDFYHLGWEDYMGSLLPDLLPSIQHVQSVTLSNWCIEAIGKIGTKRICRLPIVKFLTLKGCFEEPNNIVRLLDVFPNIKTLVLKENGDGVYMSNAKSNVEFKTDGPSKPFVTELRTIEVIWIEYNFSIFPLIEILLKYASKLEKMVFRVKGNKSPSQQSKYLFLASQKLMRMQRSSPNAELVFCEY